MAVHTAQHSELIEREPSRLAQLRQAVTPGRHAWRGAILGALSALLLILSVTAYGLFGRTSLLRVLAGLGLLVVIFGLAGGVLTLVWSVLKRIPSLFIWVLSSTVVMLAFLIMVTLSVPLGIIAAGLGTLVVGSLLGAAANELVSGRWREVTRVQRVMIGGALLIGIVGLVAGGVWLLDAGSPLAYPSGVPTLAETDLPALDMPDPSQPGPYPIRTITYGSGEDHHRVEYGVEADLLTQPVDGSRLVEGWSALRTRYWGFGPDALPLNGRAWLPTGEGPFPLVLFVHGQHPMEDYSDPGYAYLGELLASRGYIVASVDENFLNLSPLVDPLLIRSLSGEDDLRGWLLLEHLRVWRDWNEDPASDLYGLVDMDRIALAGHSRGGEAVAIAAAFNDLLYYPDDASLRFDYNFGIRSVVALAPIDGAYKPAGQMIELHNVNYLVLHGAHDMDVFTFRGSRQYGRAGFDAGGDEFKSSLYIYGANHGQFNTVWGRKDLFEPVMRVFNLEQLMPTEEQRQVAEVMISAFLEDTLQGETGYRPLFQDIRHGRTWLPDTIYLQQYADARTTMLSTYEEDIDLSSTTLAGGHISGDHLTVWREQPVDAKWETMNSQAAYLGWDTDLQPETASYTITVPESGLRVTEDSVLVFEMAMAEAGQELLDMTIEVTDRSGEAARLPLSHYAPLPPQLDGQVGKAAFMSVTPTSEPVLHHFEFQLRAFEAQNSAFAAEDLAHVRFLFTDAPRGTVVLDDVGFRD